MEVDHGQDEQEVEILPRGIKRKLEHLLLGEINLENITSKKIKLDWEGRNKISTISIQKHPDTFRDVSQ